MMRLEYIVFWILILSVIGVSIWLAFGSPDFNSSLIMIVIFVATSGVLLWKALFTIDKRTSLGFEKVKSDFKGVNEKLENIEKEVREIKEIVSVTKFI